MKRTAGRTYRHTEVSTAAGDQLILRLYDKALSCLTLAVEAIEQGEQEDKLGHLARAIDIICELMASLDLEQGPIAGNLYQLYSYMYRRLMEACLRVDVKAVNEAFGMLYELRSSWEVAIGAVSSGRAVGEPQPSAVDQEGPRPRGAY